MAAKSTARFSTNLDQGRTGGRVREGSFTFHRRQSASSAKTNMQDVVRRYSEMITGMQSVTGDILQEILEPVLHKAMIYCPVRTGDLRGSGRIVVEVSSKHRASATILFGNSGVKYAALVHERTQVFHAPPTRAKFLQSALEEELGGVLAHAAVLYASEMQ